MAANYNSFDDYIKQQEALYGDDRKIGDSPISWSSKGRDVVGSEAQWMLDNKDLLAGMNLSEEAMENLNEFFENVGSNDVESDYFGNKSIFNSNTDKFGNTEFSAYGYAIMSVNEALRSGQIDMATYQETMNTLFSDDFMDSVRAGDFSEFKATVRMFEMDRDENAIGTFRDYMDASHHDLRNVVNEVGDYYKDAVVRHGNDPEHDFSSMYHSDPAYQTGYATGPDYFSNEGFNAMTQMLDDARQKGLISDEQWKAATTKVDELDDNTWTVMHDGGAAAMYAMYEAFESGDADLIGKVVDPTNMEGIMFGTDEGVNVLREIEQHADFAEEENGPMLGAAEADDVPSVEDEDEQPDEEESPEDETPDEEESPDDTPDEETPADEDELEIPDDVQAVIDQLQLDSDEVVDAVVEDMTIRHFDDGRAGMSYEKYLDMEEVFNDLPADAQDDYMDHNPVFKEAHDFVNGIADAADELQTAAADGLTPDEISNSPFFDGQHPDMHDALFESVQHVIDGDAYSMDDVLEPEEDTQAEADDMDKVDSTLDFETGKQLAQDIWDGRYGSGQDRIDRLTEVGYSVDDIKRAQSLVNQGYNFCQNMTEDQFNQVMDIYAQRLAEHDGVPSPIPKGAVDGATIHQEEAGEVTPQKAEQEDDGATLSGAVTDDPDASAERSDESAADGLGAEDPEDEGQKDSNLMDLKEDVGIEIM